MLCCSRASCRESHGHRAACAIAAGVVCGCSSVLRAWRDAEEEAGSEAEDEGGGVNEQSNLDFMQDLIKEAQEHTNTARTFIRQFNKYQEDHGLDEIAEAENTLVAMFVFVAMTLSKMNDEKKKAVWSSVLQCGFYGVRALDDNIVAIDLPEHNVCDMGGAIKLCSSFLPAVYKIVVFSGGVPDVVYEIKDSKWTAYCMRDDKNRRFFQQTAGWMAARNIQ